MHVLFSKKLEGDALGILLFLNQTRQRNETALISTQLTGNAIIAVLLRCFGTPEPAHRPYLEMTGCAVHYNDTSGAIFLSSRAMFFRLEKLCAAKLQKKSANAIHQF